MANTVNGNTKFAVGVAAGGLALLFASKAIKKTLHRSARSGASSPFEYHLAVHLVVADRTDAQGSWVLVKCHKAGTINDLHAAVIKALGLQASEADGLSLFPVDRRGGGDDGGCCVALGPKLTQVTCLEGLLVRLPPERVQMVELICTRGHGGAPLPSTVPKAIDCFPRPGMSLPFLGNTYQLLGPEAIYTYNIAKNIFPPGADGYPYGPTVRSYSGGTKSKIGDFPTGTQFHPDAETMTTWSADANLVQELIERISEFPKMWNRPQQIKLQDFTANGLFTSSETSEDWQSGHSILPRGFNQIKIKSYAPQILSKTRAFVREWSQFHAGHCVEDVNDWLTALTADAVVACSLGLDMRNVERLGAKELPHQFIDTFRFGLGYSTGAISAKTEFGLKRFLPFFGAQDKMDTKFQETVKSMHKQVEDMVEATRLGEMGGPDSIIKSMLEDKASSGKYVHYDALYGHIVNLMIAGHETTAATLGFTLQLLAENPDCEAKALEEVRAVLKGRTEPTAEDVPKFQYVEQCFREALRLYSPVVVLSRDAMYDTMLCGHRVYQGERINVVTRALHTNPEYWGGEFGNPLSFNPDRFSPEAVRNRHPHAYHPWGFGSRACIGSQFALFEAKTFLASMLIHFRWEGMPGYKLRASTHAGGAAPSPEGLSLMIYPRPGGPLWTDSGIMQPLPALAVESRRMAQKVKEADKVTPSSMAMANGDGSMMKVLYGSNCGASQEFASQVASAARRSGFQTTTSSLDAALAENAFQADGRLIIIVTSTYNGEPPDNAVKFKAWLQKQSDGSLQDLKFAVFGVGNSQWHTYQQFPREVEAGLQRCGATPVYDLGACDVDGPSFDTDFDEWLSSLLRAIGGTAVGDDEMEGAEEAQDSLQFVLAEEFAGAGELITDIGAAMRAVSKGKEVAAKVLGLPNEHDKNQQYAMEVVKNSIELCENPEGRSVRHVTLRLPKDHPPYRSGDHLEIAPANDEALVASTLNVLGIQPDALVLWDPSKAIHWRGYKVNAAEKLWQKIPPMNVTAELVLAYVPDLAGAPSRKVCKRLARYACDAAAKEELLSLGGNPELHKEKISGTAVSFAELLQRYKGRLNLSIGQLTAVAKPLALRRYSVSSSPDFGDDSRLVTATVAQVEFTTGTGRLHRGLASSLLANAPKGSFVAGRVANIQSHFHLPENPAAPMLMVGPGTGIAPMMGFLQEREALLKKGKKLGPAVMFFGCRKRNQDFLYQKELEGHLRSGALTELHVAFSRETEQKVYVQDKIWEQRSAVWKLLQHPEASVYVCGDARAMAPDVKKAFQRVAEDCGGKSASVAANMIASMVEGNRYLEDVWAS
eukprot:TRINITY_DN4832_c1_g1_i1.p1 TRINITY_DN4832_c1_g1~~TRINITY_DN4832_c1_g1_i1.p1  ORF type:complete len:1333 (-),score=305.99 TRINITY_DN4832_c1_g1_i1:372-4370(-)